MIRFVTKTLDLQQWSLKLRSHFLGRGNRAWEVRDEVMTLFSWNLEFFPYYTCPVGLPLKTIKKRVKLGSRGNNARVVE